MHVFMHEKQKKWDSFGGPITACGSVLMKSLKQTSIAAPVS